MDGGVDMNSLQENLSKCPLLGKESIVISTKEGLSDVIPIQWGDDVEYNGTKVVLISPKK